jgi:hypothetical protein
LGGRFPFHRSGGVATIISNPRPQLIDDVDWPIDPFFHDILREYRFIVLEISPLHTHCRQLGTREIQCLCFVSWT